MASVSPSRGIQPWHFCLPGIRAKPPRIGFRLRWGDYRVFFDYKGEKSIEIASVKNRKVAYREARPTAWGAAVGLASARNTRRQ
jgi:hypothetical protein